MTPVARTMKGEGAIPCHSQKPARTGTAASGERDGPVLESPSWGRGSEAPIADVSNADLTAASPATQFVRSGIVVPFENKERNVVLRPCCAE